ncbi:RNA-binding protein [Candidatus Bathyarchaeota archaeon]|nr:RNA-binding protein [Candidatus Bathyarchaeota archaeon]
MNIYVGNLSLDVTEEELREEFKAFGDITSVSIIKDKYSGQSRGFGFVEMASKAEGEAAIAGLKGKTLKERTLDVNEARPRSDSRGGGGGGGFGGRGKQRRY